MLGTFFLLDGRDLEIDQAAGVVNRPGHFRAISGNATERATAASGSLKPFPSFSSQNFLDSFPCNRELFLDFGYGQSILAKLPYFPDIPLCKFCSVVVFAKRSPLAQHPEPVQGILAWCHILNIFGAVVSLVAVLMIYLASIWCGADKSQCDKSMNEEVARFFSLIENDMAIPLSVKAISQNMGDRLGVPSHRCYSPYLASITSLIPSFATRYIAPRIIVHFNSQRKRPDGLRLRQKLSKPRRARIKYIHFALAKLEELYHTRGRGTNRLEFEGGRLYSYRLAA